MNLLEKLNKNIDLSELEGRTALITGASSGLGRDFALLLGAAKVHLILVARSEDKLQTLKNEILENSKVHIELVSMDLSKPNSAKKLFTEIQKKELSVNILINNAGVGLHGPFAAADLKKTEAMLELNINTLTKLSHLFVEKMKEQGKGYILQVASVAGFMPLSNYAVYAATKAYVLSFSQALNWELEGSGVSSTALCPGATRTSFFEAAGHETNKFVQATMMTSKAVANIGLKAMLAREDKVVPGVVNKVTVGVTSALPSYLHKRISAEVTK